ncbi:MAG: hypothetical protein WC730_01155 [Patescibacteria group bacterium]|jgi:hypothetical protein
MFINYSVIVQPFAERHFLKNFGKKYKKAWGVTWRAICEELQRFDSLLDSSIAKVITQNDNIRIAKIEFRVHGTQESRKGSGNRCIVAVDDDRGVINVLLVYHKSDLGDDNETEKWKHIVKDNYLEYREYL